MHRRSCHISNSKAKINGPEALFTSSRRFTVNGKESDSEVKGEGNQQDYGMRVYENRLGRFLSLDPLKRKHPHYSSYLYTGNKPILFVDIDDLEEGLDIRSRRMEQGYLNGTVSEDELKEYYRMQAVGGIIGLGSYCNYRWISYLSS
jgi:RHS repeat-associated protein